MPFTYFTPDEITAWQGRPLETSYAIVLFDALRVKICDEGLVNNEAVYLAIGIRASGHKQVLSLWIEQSDGAMFWLRVMSEIRGRGTQDILIAVVDGLKGFPRSDHRRVHQHRRSELHRASHSLLDAIRLLEGTQTRGWHHL